MKNYSVLVARQCEGGELLVWMDAVTVTLRYMCVRQDAHLERFLLITLTHALRSSHLVGAGFDVGTTIQGRKVRGSISGDGNKETITLIF